MSSGLISKLIEIANYSNMNNKHAAAIVHSKRILSVGSNWSLWGSGEKLSFDQLWKKSDLRCLTERRPEKLCQKC